MFCPVSNDVLPCVTWCFALYLTMFCPVSHDVLPCISRCFALCHLMFCPVSHDVLPCVTRCFALCHTMFCPVSHDVLPCVTRCFALDHTMFCPVSLDVLPCVTWCFALCHLMFCPVSHDVLPCVTRCFALCHTMFCPVSHDVLPCITQTFNFSINWKPARCSLEKGVRGLHLDDVADDTKATSSHTGQPEGKEEPLVTPIYHTSTYKVPSVDYYLKMLEEVCINLINCRPLKYWASCCLSFDIVYYDLILCNVAIWFLMYTAIVECM